MIPVGPNDQTALSNLLASIERQAFPKKRLEVLICPEGNSEEARASGIRRAAGDVIGCLDADNQLLGFEFLANMVRAVQQDGVCGAYPGHYAWFSDDASLNRYFALLGANDPLCWWLGKADRRSWLVAPRTERVVFRGSIPSLGSNGFFVKRSCAQPHAKAWRTSHIDGCEAMRQAGHGTYTIVDSVLWHRTGLTLWGWLKKRYGYVTKLAFGQRRLWRMVNGPRDWAGVVGFAVCSLLVLPMVLISCRGYRRVKDPAWLWHPVACLLLTCSYTCAALRACLNALTQGLARHLHHAARRLRHPHAESP